MRFIPAVFLFTMIGATAAEITVDPKKVAQLKRLEPLNADKIDLFVQGRQLTPEQADLVRRSLTADGKLALPETAIASEPPRAAALPPPEALPRESAPPVRVVERSRDPYAAFNYNPSDADRELVESLVADYRKGSREKIGKRLQALRPQVNPVINAAYNDPIDLPLKVALWSEVAGPANPDAAIGLFETHRAAYVLAKPILIPYEKDIGGIHVRRSATGPNVLPLERFYDSRELREMILEIEESISKCAGPAAAIFLMNVYAERYDDGEAPMRDSGRDRVRLVRACGGNHKKFDQDKPETWTSKLAESERFAIAAQLAPWLNKSNEDRRRIARNGMMVCVPGDHPPWEAGIAEWERWLQERAPAR